MEDPQRQGNDQVIGGVGDAIGGGGAAAEGGVVGNAFDHLRKQQAGRLHGIGTLGRGGVGQSRNRGKVGKWERGRERDLHNTLLLHLNIRTWFILTFRPADMPVVMPSKPPSMM